ncbi:MICOS complex subunit mic60 [Elasticomyces elasticus]|nr:MICOS complex subunit mic60 [Elasticomyces elasticus]
MLRAPLMRSTRPLCRVVQAKSQPQWLLARQRAAFASSQRFADVKKADEVVVPTPPVIVTPPPATGTTTIPPANIPRVPPTPQEVNAIPPTTSPVTVPPTGTGSSTIAPPRPPPSSPPPPPPPPAPKRKPRRFRRFLTSLLILSTLGYAGGVYYSLVSDNFHDFFTEYIPFGEDAVGYFEEREFRKRFPSRELQQRGYPQIRGEQKVTIGKQSGSSPRLAQDEPKPSSDLASKGAHVNALEDNKPDAGQAKQAPSSATPKEKIQAVEEAKRDNKQATEGRPRKDDGAKSQELLPKADVKPAASSEVKQSAPTPAPAPTTAPTQASHIDNINIPGASEPVVQDLVKILNDIITVVNADNAASKYQSTIATAKSRLGEVLSDVNLLKAQAQKAAEDKIAASHKEFDEAARELVRRWEQELKDQEAHWKEEYESEREKLSESYNQKLAAELAAAQKVSEQKLKNSLLQREIELQRKFAEEIKSRVEAERNGRLAKLNDLSTSVSELEKLTGEWNSVVEANLASQHLHVAVETVRSAIENADQPSPFVHELAALKEVANGNEVVNAAVASINPTAYQRGIPTPAHLIDRFRRVASEVRKAALLPENAGVASHAASLLLSRFMFKKDGMPIGNDVEAVLSRTEGLLEEGDLDGAAREMNSLGGWAKVLSTDWIGECRRVLEVRQALDVISTEARLQSLLLD